MQVIYVALEISKAERITKTDIAELFSIEKSKVDIKPLMECKGDERAFRLFLKVLKYCSTATWVRY